MLLIRMGLIGGKLASRVLAKYRAPGTLDGSAYAGRSKVATLLGEQVWSMIRDAVVIDFGCGVGDDAIELARHGARHVYAVDNQLRFLQAGAARARLAGVDNITFCPTPPHRADLIISLDSFEHFTDPAAILRNMADILEPHGKVLACFGPTWYHPLGGHLFSVFPWAHLIFSEKALCQWRAQFRSDGATRFEEVEGGLNQMTIRRFVRLVERSPLRLDRLECVPIRRLSPLHNRLTREFFTAVVRCVLSPQQSGAAAAGESGEQSHRKIA